MVDGRWQNVGLDGTGPDYRRFTIYHLPSSMSPTSRRTRRLRRDQQVSFVPDEILVAVDGELVVLAHEDRRDRAGLFAHAAEDASGLVDLVDLRVARAGLHGPVVLRSLEIDRVRRTRHRAQTARHALLEPVLVAHQDLLAAPLRKDGNL